MHLVLFIGGAGIDMNLFKSPDGVSVNTSYPFLKRVLAHMTAPTRDKGQKGTYTKTGVDAASSKSGSRATICQDYRSQKQSTWADRGHEEVTLTNIRSKIIGVKVWSHRDEGERCHFG